MKHCQPVNTCNLIERSISRDEYFEERGGWILKRYTVIDSVLESLASPVVTWSSISKGNWKMKTQALPFFFIALNYLGLLIIFWVSEDGITLIEAILRVCEKFIFVNSLIYIYIYIYMSVDYNIYAPPWGLSTLVKEFSAAARIMQSSSKELSTLVADRV